MQEKIWIHARYQSQYGLLGAMSKELADAFAAKGYDAQLFNLDHHDMPTDGILFFMNVPATLNDLPPALFIPGSNMKAIQLFVDHPLALPDNIIDQWNDHNNLDNFRLCLPCLDDVHLLRPRFPNLVHSWIPHGIPRNSLCDLDAMTMDQYNTKEFDVVVTGSVRSQEEIESSLSQITDPMTRSLISEIVNLMIKEPGLGYVAACDLVMGSRGIITGKWITQKFLWTLIIAIVNRHRRIQTVESLQGLKVGVFGSKDWLPHCTGTIEYAGQVEYENCAKAFSRGRVGLAWGPTQFVHSYSERIMQAMAGGSSVVCDDRLLIRRDFNKVTTTNAAGLTAKLFDWGDRAAARVAVDQQLADPEAALAMARRGREHVENTCLWEHRVDDMIGLAQSPAAATV
ncbi:MAG: glycosyltransferase family 1 protein [Phycisphaerales bacterium]|nr:glycosyltransferase family 1 protein [Phycisphaerales bacterium]